MKLWQVPDSVFESSSLEGERQLPNFFVSDISPIESAILVQELDISGLSTAEELSVRVESLLLSLGYTGNFSVDWILGSNE